MKRIAWPLLLALPLLSACPIYDREAVRNTPPVVEPAAPRVVDGGETVTLSAEGTDAEGDPLSWSWRQTEGIPVSLSSTTEREVTFVAPLQNTVLVFEIRAHDGYDPSEPVLFRVEVRHNRPPVADAGGVWITPNGVPIRLRGTATDPDGDPIVAWQWTVVSGPPGAELDDLLGDADTRLPTFRPRVKGDYVVELVASDGDAWSEPDEALLVAENRPPVAAATANVSEDDPFTFILDGSGSWDPDGDDVTSWQWSVATTPAGATATFLDPATDPVTRVTVDRSGSYALSLTVTDPEGLESAPAQAALDVFQAPILSLNGVEFVAASGTAFDLDASETVDPDGQGFYVTWTRIAGSDAFPSQRTGVRPTITAPPYRALLEAGAPTWAVYEVVAHAGPAASPPQTVTLYAAPGADEAVILSSRPEADDDGDCGDLHQPCATLARAREVITGASEYGDGRLLLVTTGNFETATVGSFTWPRDVDVIGGLHPTRFVRSGTRTNLRLRNLLTDCGIANISNGIFFPVGTTARLEGLDAELVEFSCASARTFTCSGCELALHDVRAALAGSTRNRTVYVLNGGKLEVSMSEIRASSGGYETHAIFASGSDVVVQDGHLSATGTSSWTLAALTHTGGGSVVVERSFLTTQGGHGEMNTGATLRVEAGRLSLSNSVVHQQIATRNRPAVRTGGETSIVNATLLASSQAVEPSWALVAGDELRLFNVVVGGAFGGLLLSQSASRQSRLYHNVISADGPPLRCPDGEGGFLSVFDLEEQEDCNDSDAPWAGNVAGSCLFMDAAAGDFRPLSGVDNPCIDGGAAVSPAGTAPDHDKLGNPRPAGTAHDIGAYEVQD